MQCFSAMFLILAAAEFHGSADGCQGFSGVNMRNGG
jgi:hypothetical protein